MKAEIGDYITFEVLGSGRIMEKVVGIEEGTLFGNEIYETISGWYVNSFDLTIDDVKLPSEVEIG